MTQSNLRTLPDSELDNHEDDDGEATNHEQNGETPQRLQSSLAIKLKTFSIRVGEAPYVHEIVITGQQAHSQLTKRLERISDVVGSTAAIEEILATAHVAAEDLKARIEARRKAASDKLQTDDEANSDIQVPSIGAGETTGHGSLSRRQNDERRPPSLKFAYDPKQLQPGTERGEEQAQVPPAPISNNIEAVSIGHKTEQVSDRTVNDEVEMIDNSVPADTARRLRRTANILQLFAFLTVVTSGIALIVGTPYTGLITWGIPVFIAILLIGMVLEHSAEYLNQAGRA